MQQFKAHAGSIYQICVNPSGSRLATIGSDAFIRYWDIWGQKRLWESRLFPIATDIDLSENEQLLVTGSEPGDGFCFDTKEGKKIFEIPRRNASRVDFTPDQKYIAVHHNHKLRLFNCKTRSLMDSSYSLEGKYCFPSRLSSPLLSNPIDPLPALATSAEATTTAHSQTLSPRASPPNLSRGEQTHSQNQNLDRDTNQKGSDYSYDGTYYLVSRHYLCRLNFYRSDQQWLNILLQRCRQVIVSPENEYLAIHNARNFLVVDLNAWRILWKKETEIFKSNQFNDEAVKSIRDCCQNKQSNLL